MRAAHLPGSVASPARARAAFATASLLVAASAGPLAGCRSLTGLDEFELECIAGENGCPIPDALEDCADRRDANGDGILPAECSGEVEWLRTTPGNLELSCPNETFGNYQIDPSRRLLAMMSFGSWTGTFGSVRGTAGGCFRTCVHESNAFDGDGARIELAPQGPCDDDSGAFHALARGQERAYAMVAQEEEAAEAQGPRSVTVSIHRLSDATLASTWTWTPPDVITSIALAADTAAVAAIGQPGRVLFAEPDESFPRTGFRDLPGASATTIALATTAGARTLLLGGHTTDAGPCGLGATAPTAFVAAAPLDTEASLDPASPTPLTCTTFPVRVELGADTGSPSMKVVAGKAGRACWAHLGNDDASDRRQLRTGCFDLDGTTFDWTREAAIGTAESGDIEIAVDPFGHLLLTTIVRSSAPIPLWGGAEVVIAASAAPNVLVLKLHRDTGAVLWGTTLSAGGGNARLPRITVADDASPHLGVVTDGQPLRGNGLGPLDGVSGQAVHFLGLRP